LSHGRLAGTLFAEEELLMNMKRIAALLLLAAVLVLPLRGMASEASQYSPNDDYDDSQSHPLRIAAYLAHPVGVALEWLVFRPFHRVVSQPGAAYVFGHREHGDDASIAAR
jgi:hypothetical protein